MHEDRLLKGYEGAFETWKARLAISRIKALGFPKQDWPDLMQELAIVILEFNYDPHHAAGAKEETALYAAINRHLLFLMRGRCRDRKRFEQYLRTLGIREDGTYIKPEPCIELEVPIEPDVKQACAGLSDFDQAVAQSLAAGLNGSAIGRQLGCERQTVYKAIRRIRLHFQERGMGPEDMR